MLARRHLVLVNVMQTAGMKPLFTRERRDVDARLCGLAGQMRGTVCGRCGSRCRIAACRLSIVDPERIKAQVTAEYLEVKRRQVL